MRRRAVKRHIGNRRKTPQVKKAKRKSGTVVTIPYPIDPELATWEVELLGINKEAFLALWQGGGDRIGYSVADRLIYDKHKPIARILRKLKRPRSAEEE